MNDDSILGGTLNQLGQTVKQAAKQVVKIPAASAESSGEPKEEEKQQWRSDEERIRFLKDLYGSVQPSADAKAMADKEEQKKLLELRNQLHKEVYYDPTFNPVKKQEERPAEKVENEKKQEMQDLQQKDAKKPQPLAVTREQNKAEMFRGATG